MLLLLNNLQARTARGLIYTSVPPLDKADRVGVCAGSRGLTILTLLAPPCPVDPLPQAVQQLEARGVDAGRLIAP